MITDKWLDKITMYRLTLYYLLGLTFWAAFLGVFNLTPYTPTDVGLSLLTAVVVSAVANYIFARLFHAITNIESVYITALILVLIVPAQFPTNLLFISLASIVAMASKYLLTIDKQHVFNPAAIAVIAIPFLFPAYNATWWVGMPLMMPLVLVGGFLLVRRIRRERMVTIFLAVYFITVITSAFFHQDIFGTLLNSLQISFLSSPVWFLGMVMLTEPLTSPNSRTMQTIYAIIVGFFTASLQLKPFGVVMTPETALALGNVFTFFVNPRYRLALPFIKRLKLTPDTYAFIFQHESGMDFRPGQYMEWTLPHAKTDERGNRRYFTIASSPTEDKLMIGVKFYSPLSSYKKRLLQMREGDKIIAAQLAGDFVLPKKSEPMVFIAGGIGITPFRSMIEYIVDQNVQSDIVLLFSNKRVEDIVFTETFEEARRLGVRTVYTLTDKPNIPIDWQGSSGYVDKAMILREVPDYTQRRFYVSGPQLMVQAFEKTLQSMGVPKNKIVTDYFPGFSGK